MSEEIAIVRLARIEEKLDLVLVPLKVTVEENSTRIGALERWKSHTTGAVAVILIVIGWIITVIK